MTALAKTSNTMLNKSGESEHPCFFPYLRGNASNFSSLSVMLAEGLSYMSFIMLRYIPFMHNLLSIFSMTGCRLPSNKFSPFIDMIKNLFFQ